MEFQFDVNALLTETINKIDSSLNVNSANVITSNKDFRLQILKIIDDIGIASAKAQELQAPITSGEKFKSSEHIIYLMKDKKGNQGKGSVVGVLKIGHKKLFLLDLHGNQNELSPLCVLDFYIHESQQRKGYGKELFEFMLQDKNVEPYELAIDRPSSKFLFFLNKHYNLNEIIPQVNKFTIFKEFFPSKSLSSGSIPIPYRHSDPTGGKSLRVGSFPEEENSRITHASIKNATKSGNRASFPSANINSQSLWNARDGTQDNSKSWSAKSCNYSRHFHEVSPSKEMTSKTSPRDFSSPTDHGISGHFDFSVAKNSSFGKTSDDCSSYSSGKSKQYDSSLNIFGVPASWNQPSCSVTSGQSVHQ